MSEWVAIKKVVWYNGRPWEPNVIEYTPLAGAEEWLGATTQEWLTSKWSAAFHGATEKIDISPHTPPIDKDGLERAIWNANNCLGYMPEDAPYLSSAKAYIAEAFKLLGMEEEL